MNALDELKSIPHWVGHKNKVPMNARTGATAQSNNPQTWADVNTTWRGVKRYGWDGLGYVFTIGKGIVGVDLDDCFVNGSLKPWARDVVLMLDSYTEYSPSGKGLHVYARGEIPGSVNKSSRGFEMYNELRYFTVTGRGYLAWGKDQEIKERGEQLRALHFVFSEETPDSPAPPYPIQNVRATEVQEALSHIPVQMDYYDWLRVLMAVHDGFPGPEGVAMCEAWSPGYPKEIQKKFASFDKTAKSGVTIRTLFHYAAQHGYLSNKSKPSRPRRNPNDLRAAI